MGREVRADEVSEQPPLDVVWLLRVEYRAVGHAPAHDSACVVRHALHDPRASGVGATGVRADRTPQSVLVVGIVERGVRYRRCRRRITGRQAQGRSGSPAAAELRGDHFAQGCQPLGSRAGRRRPLRQQLVGHVAIDELFGRAIEIRLERGDLLREHAIGIERAVQPEDRRIGQGPGHPSNAVG